MPTIRSPVVHIIDDDADVRSLVGEILADVDVDCVLWESPGELLAAASAKASSADAATDAATGFRANVLVVDVRLRGMSGMELVRRLRDLHVDAPVIFMSGVSDVPVAVEAMKLGAVDFLSKPFRAQTMIDVVQAALRQESTRGQQNAALAEHRELVAKLSPREMQVFLGVIAGKANKVLASDLGLSEKTVEDHRARMMSKLSAQSVADLVKIGVLAGLCDPLTERSRR